MAVTPLVNVTPVGVVVVVAAVPEELFKCVQSIHLLIDRVGEKILLQRYFTNK